MHPTFSDGKGFRCSLRLVFGVGYSLVWVKDQQLYAAPLVTSKSQARLCVTLTSCDPFTAAVKGERVGLVA